MKKKNRCGFLIVVLIEFERIESIVYGCYAKKNREPLYEKIFLLKSTVEFSSVDLHHQ